MIPGIAYTLRKNILVINTKPLELSMDPFTLVLPDTFGRPANTGIPLLLAYDGCHFEGMLPETSEDTSRTVELVREIQSKKYRLKVSDVQCLSGALQERIQNASPVKKKTKATEKVLIV